MHPLKLTVAAMLLVLTAFDTAFSQKIYVSGEKGNDASSGSSMQPGKDGGPLATLGEAFNRIQRAKGNKSSKDTIYILLDGGDHPIQQTLMITPEMTHNWNIVVQSATTRKARIIGASKYNLKLARGAAIQQFPMGKAKHFEQLYTANGTPLLRSREPNTGFYYSTNIKEDTIKAGAEKSYPPAISSYRIKSAQLDNAKLSALAALPEADLRNILTSLLYKWAEKKVYLFKVDTKDGRIITSPRNGMKDFVQWGKGIQFFLENSLSFLDTPNEWFLDRNNTLHLFTGKLTAAKSVDYYAPAVETMIALEGAAGKKLENVQFRNVEFAFSALFTPKDGFVNQQTVPYVNAAVMLNYSDNIGFDNCEFSSLGNNAIWFKTGCSNSSVSNSQFHDLGAGAVKIGDYQPGKGEKTTRITVNNNLMHAGGEILYSAAAVAVYLSSDNKVTNNTIFDFKYTGISNGFNWTDVPSGNGNNYFAYNHIHHLGWGIMDDLAGIYSVGNSEGTRIENNLIHDIYCYRYGGNGIYLDEGSAGLSITNNVVYNCESAGFMCGHAKNSTISNNVFANNKNAQLFFGYAKGEKAPGLKFTNNIVYWDQGKLQEEPNLPDFVSDQNLYWSKSAQNNPFNGLSQDNWSRQTGKEKRSIVKDPQFRNGNFADVASSAAASINFKPINTNNVGARPWKGMTLSPNRIKNFQKSVSIKSAHNSRY
ncbi:right-handed parallel beta-helix repeat-containing protein [Chitinophaga caseinilytica]|uniref:right-handed parallel beta-helix repeat-containing protein n=1 Tax=Chitinophaga caseinilytica TaxID=2267521 RepID=UPI003C2E8136